MPKSIIFWNSDLATSSFSPKSLRALAKTGGPVVGTVCLRPCFAGRDESNTEAALVTDGKEENSSNTAADGHLRPQSPPKKRAGRARTTASPESAEQCFKHCPGMSIIRLLARKKSVPRTGFFTSARRKRCETLRPGKDKERVFSPKVLILDPLAACNTVKLGLTFCSADAGKTDTSAPLSTRKGRRERLQNTDKAPWRGWGLAEVEGEEDTTDIRGGEPGATGGPRRDRFPWPLEKVSRKTWHERRSSSCKTPGRRTCRPPCPTVREQHRECLYA